MNSRHACFSEPGTCFNTWVSGGKKISKHFKSLNQSSLSSVQQAKMRAACVLLVLAIAFAACADAQCTKACPRSNQADKVIYSAKPSFFIAEYSIEGRGGLCCTCAANCSYTAGCVAHICAADDQRWIGFGGERVDCQLFGAQSPEPSETTTLAVYYGWLCLP
jgi:hypothetical protein